MLVLLMTIIGCTTMGNLAPLKTTKIAIGMTKEQVKGLWGEPNITWYPNHKLTEYEKALFKNPSNPQYYNDETNPDEAWYYAPTYFSIFPKKGWDILFKEGIVVKVLQSK